MILRKKLWLIDASFCKKLPQSDKNLNLYKGEEILPSLRQLSVPKQDQIVQCISGLNSIGGVTSDRCTLDEIPTNEGICYTFNLLDTDEMFKDNV